ncbi:MAG: UbiX family flavin prenyltransferase [Planctomycetota bacterium]
MTTEPKRIVVGITGASGAIYAQRMVQLAVAAGVHTHLVVSPLGRRLLHDELGMETLDLAALSGLDRPPDHLVYHDIRDVGATIASGSFRHDGMAIIPCSSNSLSAVASGQASNLIHRAAHVTLKERRKLVLVHREAPLSLVDIRNMEAATLAGAIVMPANPGFYTLPKTVEDVVDFVVGRTLDLLGVEHDLAIRWEKIKPSLGKPLGKA